MMKLQFHLSRSGGIGPLVALERGHLRLQRIGCDPGCWTVSCRSATPATTWTAITSATRSCMTGSTLQTRTPRQWKAHKQMRLRLRRRNQQHHSQAQLRPAPTSSGETVSRRQTRRGRTNWCQKRQKHLRRHQRWRQRRRQQRRRNRQRRWCTRSVDPSCGSSCWLLACCHTRNNSRQLCRSSAPTERRQRYAISSCCTIFEPPTDSIGSSGAEADDTGQQTDESKQNYHPESSFSPSVSISALSHHCTDTLHPDPRSPPRWCQTLPPLPP